MRIAVFQETADPLRIEHNLGLIDAAAAAASDQGAALLLTPELFAVGYAPARVRAEVGGDDVAEAHRALEEIARRHRIGLVYSLPGDGAPEDRGITATLVDEAGRRLAHYQKVHLFGPHERAAFTPGEARPPVVDCAGLRLSLAVCYDIEFPEIARAAATAGAELLLVPTALAGDAPEIPQVLIPARALENRMTVAYANHTGVEDGLDFDGRSVVAGPDGAVLGTLDGSPGLLVVDVEPRPAPGPDGPWYLEDLRPEVHRTWLDPEGTASPHPEPR